MCLKAEDTTLLNINDCEVNTRAQAEDIRQRVGPVDVLFTQFSYAAWFGNRDEIDRRRAAAARKLESLALQADVLQPRFVVPFASFVWFCHEENFFVNTGMNEIGEVARFVRDRHQEKVVVLYPGDTWEVAAEHDSEKSIHCWENEYRSLKSRPRLHAAPIAREELLETGRRHVAERRQRINKLVAHLYGAAVTHPLRGRRGGSKRGWAAWLAHFFFLRVEPVRVWIPDHKCAYQLDSRSFCQTGLSRDRCDLELSADSLLFCFRLPWGCETLQINGRFQEVYRDGFRSLAGYFRLGRILHHGHQSLIELIEEAMKIVLRGARRQFFKQGAA